MTAPRRGFTLPELLIAIVMLVIVGGSLGMLLTSQYRIFNRTQGATQMQRDLRTGLGLLPLDLRAASRAAGDITVLQDTAIQLQATIGSSVVCARPAAFVVDLPPLETSRNALTEWHIRPAAGDTVLLYDENTRTGPEDDRWLPYAVESLAHAPAASCAGAPFTDPTLDPPATKPRWRLTLSANPPLTTSVGSPLRFLRSTRYSLFQPPGASATGWYLGYREYVGGVWQQAEPIAGPFESPAGPRAGLRFTYYDTLGQLLAAPTGAAVGRVDLAFRARALVRGGTKDTIVLRDSVAVRVALRNRL
ncbi:prepilin-type N-terminal cleavage/methylation domain-containing protein [Roseisolibacter sp. H3M3-2]|uniref:PilW family protein n=1 Tax=Roseisolibacter sp. H3M3-2 TaxID=3031323 RepID=UPI0023DB9500|nr:prepilin-type N-terminal cleavage/methylation domain-containing protein [Roseisolibacter sp. H3M3-2]